MKNLKIGELAKLVGRSVRSLHHYDELGLLMPSAGRKSQHRLYNAADVARLQQIISLKNIGFSLAEIKQCLQNRDFDLKTSLAMHKEMIEKSIEEYQNIDQILRLMLSRLEQNHDIETEEFLMLIKDITQMEKIYSKEQLQTLKDRYEKYGLDKVQEVEDGWLKLFKQFEIALEKGLAPEKPAVQMLAKLAQEYIDLFTGKDKEIEARLDESYAQQQSQALEKWGVKKEVFDYAIKARKIFKNK